MNIRDTFGKKRFANIVTKANVERLEALRARPTPVQHMRPRHLDHAYLDNQLDRHNEEALEGSKGRLQIADYKLNKGMTQALHQDRAKLGFNKASVGTKNLIQNSHER